MIARVPDRGPAGPLIVELLLDRIGAHNRQRAFAEWNLIKTRSADYANKSLQFNTSLPQAIDYEISANQGNEVAGTEPTSYEYFCFMQVDAYPRYGRKSDR
jgi:hypothetical protein